MEHSNNLEKKKSLLWNIVLDLVELVTRKNFEFDVFVSHKPDYFCSGIQSGNIKVVDRNLQTCLLLSCDHILEIFSKMKWFEEHSAGQKQSSSMKCFLAQWNYSFSYWKWVSKEKQQIVLSEECLLENYQNEVLSLLLYVIILLLLFSFTSPVSICGLLIKHTRRELLIFFCIN